MPRLLAVLVGCDYQDAGRPELPELRGAENDARSLAALLAQQPIANGELALLTLITREEATTAQIRQALRRTRRALRPDDNLLFYFAGHGSRDDTGLTLYTWDSEYPATQLIADCGKRPKKTDIILDCCHAGAAVPTASAAHSATLMLQYSKDKLCFLCGATADQSAGEDQGHGLFTQTLITTLAAPHDPALLSLPVDLDVWCAALPKDLRENYHPMATPTDVLPNVARGSVVVRGQPPPAAGTGQNWETAYSPPPA